MSYQTNHVPNQLQRVQQGQAARQNMVRTTLNQHQLQNMTPAGMQAMANSIAGQHVHSLTQAAQNQLAQNMYQQMAAYQNQTMYSGLGGYSSIPITTSTTVPMGSVFVTNNSTAYTSASTSTVYMHPTQAVALSQYVTGLTVTEAERLGIDDVEWHVKDGQEKRIFLPDGSIIDVAKDGSFQIKDDNAKVTYRANRVRDFNKFLNVSDRLEEFIAFCGNEGVRRGDMLELPLKLFIGWLAVEAAKADREDPPDVELLGPLHRIRTPRCRGCGQHLPVPLLAAKIDFCSPPCFEKQFQRLTAPPPMLMLPAPERVAA